MTPPSGTLAPPDTEVTPRTGEASQAEGVDRPQAAAVSRRPAQARGLEFIGTLQGSGYEKAPALVRRADGQTLQLSPVLYAVLESIDGRRDYAAVAEEVSRRIGKRASAEHVEHMVEAKLRPLGILQTHDGLEPVTSKANPLLGLRWRFVVSNPRVTRRITAPFAQLFRPWIAVPLLLAFAAVSVWVLIEKGLASATHRAMYEPGMLLVVFALTMISAGFHEFGHAAGCRYGGATPGVMGMGLYLVWPAFYTEVSDSYRLDRRGRLRVDVGGLYFNAIFAVAMAGVWAATRVDAILLLIPAQLFQMLRQLLPFVRFDGYHILADLTGVPDLFSHLKPTVLAMLPGRWRRPQPRTLKRWARVVVSTWVLLVIPVLLFSLFMMIKVMPRIAATAWDSLGNQWSVLQVNVGNGDAAAVAVGVLAMFTIALPVAAMAYLLARITRRIVRGVWRATEGKPGQRAASVAAAAALLGLLVWAWWPDGQYQPIRADEQGSVIGGIDPSPPTLVADPTPVAAAGFTPAPLVDGQPAMFAGPAPYAPVEVIDGQVPDQFAGTEPVPALILTPADDPDAPPTIIVLPEPGEDTSPEVADSWPFPFNPPRAAREQDNQALAVNTADGTTVYDVSVAMVWVTDGDIDERNDAYALASCHDCRTVAVAFQVVFGLGRVHTTIPQNVAIAVNYACHGCSTFALAVQLVVTLTDTPSEQAMARIEAVWQQVEEFAETIEDIPLNELTARVTGFESALMQILVEEDGASATSNTTAAGMATPGATESPSEVATTAPETDSMTATETPASEPAVTGTEEPAAEPSSGDTSTDTSGEDAAGDTDAGSATAEPEPAPEPQPSAEPAPIEEPAAAEPTTTATEAPSG